MKIEKQKTTTTTRKSLHIFIPHLISLPEGYWQYRAQWKTGDNISVTSIQDRYFRDFSIPQLFLCELSTFLVVISYTQFSFSAHEKNRETAKPSDPVLTS